MRSAAPPAWRCRGTDLPTAATAARGLHLRAVRSAANSSSRANSASPGPARSATWSTATTSRRSTCTCCCALHEAGDGEPYAYPQKEYFKLPFAYWTDEEAWYVSLSFAAKATLLVALSLRPPFVLPAERAPAWYGLSADTVDRGLRDHQRDPDVYMLAAAVCGHSALTPAREAITALRLKGQVKLHWHDESDKRRQLITETIAGLRLDHLVVVRDGQPGEKPERRRRHCLERMLWELDQLEVGIATFESRGPVDDRRDRLMLDALRARTGGSSPGRVRELARQGR